MGAKQIDYSYLLREINFEGYLKHEALAPFRHSLISCLGLLDSKEAFAGNLDRFNHHLLPEGSDQIELILSIANDQSLSSFVGPKIQKVSQYSTQNKSNQHPEKERNKK